MSLASDIVDHINSIPLSTNKLVYGYIHSCQRAFGHQQNNYDNNDNMNLYTIPESIFIQCLLFYYIDYKQCHLQCNIYDMFIDPSHCGNDIDLQRWLKSLQEELDFEYDSLLQEEIFNIMDHNKCGWIHKSDFVIFTTSIYSYYPNSKCDKNKNNLQKILMEAINDIDTECKEYQNRQKILNSSKEEHSSKVKIYLH